MTLIAPRRPPDESDPFKVFLSHAFVDTKLVLLVRDQLRALGVDVYLAEHDPRPGTSIANKIENAIKDAHVIVVLLTDDGYNSPYVQQEIGVARTLGKLIIPLLAHNVDRGRLGMLADIEWIEINQDEPSAALVSVTASMHSLLEKRRSELFERREAELLDQQTELHEKHQAVLLQARARERAALEARDRANGLALVTVVLCLIMVVGSRKVSA